MRSLYTIGYEGLSIEAFLSILKGNQIERIIDIRRNPISRKSGFAKTPLSQFLSTANIDYSHMVSLGTPNEIRRALKSNNDYDAFFENMEEYVRGQTEAIHVVLDMALTQNCALLCFERDPNECHRVVVAAQVARISNLEVSVEHIEL